MRRTTNSSGVIRFENRLEGLVLTGIDQAYASDITYFEVNNRFYYLTFIIDCYSRRILGHSLSERLTTEQTTLPALKNAIKTRKSKLPAGIIFHSDGGGQYYDKEFLKTTAEYRFLNSMCEYAYQNGKAERLNGVIKNNYLKHLDCSTKTRLKKNLDRSVDLYNREKPHKALRYLTPVEFENNLHLQTVASHSDPVNG
jgi:putative transposase